MAKKRIRNYEEMSQEELGLMAMSLKDENNGIYDFEDDLANWQMFHSKEEH